MPVDLTDLIVQLEWLQNDMRGLAQYPTIYGENGRAQEIAALIGAIEVRIRAWRQRPTEERRQDERRLADRRQDDRRREDRREWTG